jgi:hypothetical protein
VIPDAALASMSHHRRVAVASSTLDAQHDALSAMPWYRDDCVAAP